MKKIASLATAGLLLVSLSSAVSPVVSAAEMSHDEVTHTETMPSVQENSIPTDFMINGKHVTSVSLSKDFHLENQTPSQRGEGINKVVENGNRTTVYISRTNVKRILAGASVVIGGYTTGTLAVVLGLAGLGAGEAVSNGVVVTFEMIPDWNGQYHLTLISFGWQ